MKQHTVLISCPDEKGLIHKITGALSKREFNIVENSEHVDHTSKTFFMRTEFTGSAESKALANELKSILPKDSKIELHEQKTRNLVLYATREPHCLGDLLLRHSFGELKAKITAVISQYDTLAELTKKFDVPFHHVPADGLSREEHERKLLKVTQTYKPDYLVLAKYMRILTEDFVKQFPNQILNIHHSFLPAFIGKSPYLQAYERGVKIIGATAHFVNEHLDEGPIITQSVIPVNHSLDAAEMAHAGRDIERIVLARALNLILEDRVIVHGRRTIVFE